MKIHLANAVVDRIPEKKLLHTMWEDADLEGNDIFNEHYDWIEEYAPGMFVLIDTGDYLVPECCRWVPGSRPAAHEGCETYDATYALYLVPMSVWNACSERVLAANLDWHLQHNRCQLAAKGKNL